MKKFVILLLFCVAGMVVMAQDATTGATTPAQPDSAVTAKHATGLDLSYTLVIVNKTGSNYRVTLDNHFLGKVPPKKKQSFKAQTDWAGKLVAVQLDGYDIIPSKINWTVPKQTAGTTVTFTITNK